MCEIEFTRRAAHRLSVIRHAQEVTGKASLAYRQYCITRQRHYEWLLRYEERGMGGLRDRSSALRNAPNSEPATREPRVSSR